jgi:hypothetical protein
MKFTVKPVRSAVGALQRGRQDFFFPSRLSLKANFHAASKFGFSRAVPLDLGASSALRAPRCGAPRSAPTPGRVPRHAVLPNALAA